ncbi:MAG TPA: MFS transporter, partial [Thermaerobacter sp.]
LWLARIVSVTGGMASMMAMQWWVLDVTGSAQAMAALGALFTVVVAAVSLPAGVWVDRLQRGRLFLALELARGVFMAALAAALLSGRASIPLVFTLLALDAAAMALFMPLSTAIWPELIPAARLTAANALVAAGENVGRIAGPALGGLLAARHAGWAAAANAVSYLLSAVAVLLAGALGWSRPARPAVGAPVAAGATLTRSSFRDEVLSGLRVVFGRQDLGAFFILVSFLNLTFGAAFVLIPVLGRDVLQAGPQGLGWLQAAMAAGGLAAGALAGWRSLPTSTPLWMGLLLAEAGLMGTLGWFPVLAVNCGLLFLVGAANALVNTLALSALQWMIPAELRGRVFGLLFTFAMVLQPLGQLAGGAMADRFPLPWVFAGAGLSVVGVLAVAWVRAPELRDIVERARQAGGTVAAGNGSPAATPVHG